MFRPALLHPLLLPRPIRRDRARHGRRFPVTWPLVSLTASTRANAAALPGDNAARARPQVQVGLGLLPASSPPAPSANGTAVPGNAQLHYTVRDDKSNILLDDFQSADPTQPGTWQPLQVGLRLQQGGTVELRVETADALHPDVFFDDVQLDYTASTIVQEQHSYAYGAPLLGLNYVVGTTRYRHGYQGQYAERDEETGTDDFELRNYDSRIGRWTAPDPAGQFDSPYVGMGNDPVSNVDADGSIAWSSILPMIQCHLLSIGAGLSKAAVAAALIIKQAAIGATTASVRIAGQGPGKGTPSVGDIYTAFNDAINGGVDEVWNRAESMSGFARGLLPFTEQRSWHELWGIGKEIRGYMKDVVNE